LTEELKEVEDVIAELDRKITNVDEQINELKKGSENSTSNPKKVPLPKKRKVKEVQDVTEKEHVRNKRRTNQKKVPIQLDNAVVILPPNEEDVVEKKRQQRVNERKHLFRVRENVLEYADFVLMVSEEECHSYFDRS
jgi:hypothetical protein